MSQPSAFLPCFSPNGPPPSYNATVGQRTGRQTHRGLQFHFYPPTHAAILQHDGERWEEDGPVQIYRCARVMSFAEFQARGLHLLPATDAQLP
jgi:hypothetical protein